MQLKKWAQDLNRCFAEEAPWLTNKSVRRCSSSGIGMSKPKPGGGTAVGGGRGGGRLPQGPAPVGDSVGGNRAAGCPGTRPGGPYRSRLPLRSVQWPRSQTNTRKKQKVTITGKPVTNIYGVLFVITLNSRRPEHPPRGAQVSAWGTLCDGHERQRRGAAGGPRPRG